jgi:hypothetical protein
MVIGIAVVYLLLSNQAIHKRFWPCHDGATNGYAVLVCLLCRVSCLRKLKRILINIKLLSATVWKQISNQYYGMYKSFFSVETRTDEFLLENSEKSSELPVGFRPAHSANLQNLLFASVRKQLLQQIDREFSTILLA